MFLSPVSVCPLCERWFLEPLSSYAALPPCGVDFQVHDGARFHLRLTKILCFTMFSNNFPKNHVRCVGSAGASEIEAARMNSGEFDESVPLALQKKHLAAQASKTSGGQRGHAQATEDTVGAMSTALPQCQRAPSNHSTGLQELQAYPCTLLQQFIPQSTSSPRKEVGHPQSEEPYSVSEALLALEAGPQPLSRHARTKDMKCLAEKPQAVLDGEAPPSAFDAESLEPTQNANVTKERRGSISGPLQGLPGFLETSAQLLPEALECKEGEVLTIEDVRAVLPQLTGIRTQPTCCSGMSSQSACADSKDSRGRNEHRYSAQPLWAAVHLPPAPPLFDPQESRGSTVSGDDRVGTWLCNTAAANVAAAQGLTSASASRSSSERSCLGQSNADITSPGTVTNAATSMATTATEASEASEAELCMASGVPSLARDSAPCGLVGRPVHRLQPHASSACLAPIAKVEISPVRLPTPKLATACTPPGYIVDASGRSAPASCATPAFDSVHAVLALRTASNAAQSGCTTPYMCFRPSSGRQPWLASSHTCGSPSSGNISEAISPPQLPAPPSGQRLPPATTLDAICAGLQGQPVLVQQASSMIDCALQPDMELSVTDGRSSVMMPCNGGDSDSADYVSAELGARSFLWAPSTFSTISSVRKQGVHLQAVPSSLTETPTRGCTADLSGYDASVCASTVSLCVPSNSHSMWRPPSMARTPHASALKLEKLLEGSEPAHDTASINVHEFPDEPLPQNFLDAATCPPAGSWEAADDSEGSGRFQGSQVPCGLELLPSQRDVQCSGGQMPINQGSAKVDMAATERHPRLHPVRSKHSCSRMLNRSSSQERSSTPTEQDILLDHWTHVPAFPPESPAQDLQSLAYTTSKPPEQAGLPSAARRSSEPPQPHDVDDCMPFGQCVALHKGRSRSEAQDWTQHSSAPCQHVDCCEWREQAQAAQLQYRKAMEPSWHSLDDYPTWRLEHFQQPMSWAGSSGRALQQLPSGEVVATQPVWNATSYGVELHAHHGMRPRSFSHVDQLQPQSMGASYASPPCGRSVDLSHGHNAVYSGSILPHGHGGALSEVGPNCHPSKYSVYNRLGGQLHHHSFGTCHTSSITKYNDSRDEASHVLMGHTDCPDDQAPHHRKNSFEHPLLVGHVQLQPHSQGLRAPHSLHAAPSWSSAPTVSHRGFSQPQASCSVDGPFHSQNQGPFLPCEVPALLPGQHKTFPLPFNTHPYPRQCYSQEQVGLQPHSSMNRSRQHRGSEAHKHNGQLRCQSSHSRPMYLPHLAPHSLPILPQQESSHTNLGCVSQRTDNHSYRCFSEPRFQDPQPLPRRQPSSLNTLELQQRLHPSQPTVKHPSTSAHPTAAYRHPHNIPVVEPCGQYTADMHVHDARMRHGSNPVLLGDETSTDLSLSCLQHVMPTPGPSSKPASVHHEQLVAGERLFADGPFTPQDAFRKSACLSLSSDTERSSKSWQATLLHTLPRPVGRPCSGGARAANRACQSASLPSDRPRLPYGSPPKGWLSTVARCEGHCVPSCASYEVEAPLQHTGAFSPIAWQRGHEPPLQGSRDIQMESAAEELFMTPASKPATEAGTLQGAAVGCRPKESSLLGPGRTSQDAASSEHGLQYRQSSSHLPCRAICSLERPPSLNDAHPPSHRAASFERPLSASEEVSGAAWARSPPTAMVSTNHSRPLTHRSHKNALYSTGSYRSGSGQSGDSVGVMLAGHHTPDFLEALTGVPAARSQAFVGPRNIRNEAFLPSVEMLQCGLDAQGYSAEDYAAAQATISMTAATVSSVRAALSGASVQQSSRPDGEGYPHTRLPAFMVRACTVVCRVCLSYLFLELSELPVYTMCLCHAGSLVDLWEC
jgi:hypothetical protein